MPPALADEHVATGCDCTESIAQAASKLPSRACRRIEPKNSTSLAEFHQIPSPIADVADRRAISDDQRPIRRGRNGVDGMQLVIKHRPGTVSGDVVIDMDFSSAECHHQAAGRGDRNS
jgi:hypothetical protein